MGVSRANLIMRTPHLEALFVVVGHLFFFMLSFQDKQLLVSAELKVSVAFERRVSEARAVSGRAR